MTFTLHAAVLPTFGQMLGTTAALIERAEAFVADTGLAPDDILQARLAPDMLPFAYQVKSVAVHSAGAMEAARTGLFTPDMAPPPDSFAGLRERLAAARMVLDGVTDAEVDGWVGRDVRFEYGNFRRDFLVEDFLLSFSQPNFFFHATTAYAILRAKGVALGKMDFLGAVRVRPSA